MIPLLVVAISLAGVVLEFLTLPKQRDQLDIPRGDVLSALLGCVPPAGVFIINVYVLLRGTVPVYWPLLIFGLATGFASLFVRAWGKVTLGRYYIFSIDVHDDHPVIEDGPYRWVRHPLYLGAFLGALSLPAIAHSWIAVLVFSIPVTVLYLTRLHLEDKFLADTLGEDYRRSAERTARVIPFIW